MRKLTVKKHKRTDRGGAVLWMVSGTAPNGERVRKYFKTRMEAEGWADERNRGVVSVGWNDSELTDEEKREARAGFDSLADTGHTLTEAVAHYLKHIAETERSVTVADAVAELMEAKEGKGLSARHIINLRYFLKPFAEKFGKRKISTLTRREIEAWMNGRKLHPVSYKSTLTHLSLLFNHAKKNGTAPANPIKDIEPPRTAPGEKEIMTPAAMREALAIARRDHPDMIAALAIEGFAGLRRAEVQRLEWSEIDLTNGQIRVTAKKAKTKNRRPIAIQPNLSAWLSIARRESGAVAPSCFDTCFAEIRRKVVAAGHAFPKNALRSSFVSYRLEASGDDERTAKDAGHSVDTLHRDYKALTNAKTAAAWWGILPSDAAGGNIVALAKPAAAPVDKRRKAAKAAIA